MYTGYRCVHCGLYWEYVCALLLKPGVIIVDATENTVYASHWHTQDIYRVHVQTIHSPIQI